MRKSHPHRRSATRAAARPSALLLRLVARISGWLKAWLARWNPLRRARKAVADYSHNLGRIHFETLEPRLLMSADLMPLAQTTLAPHATVAVERSSVADTSVANVARMHALAVAPGATGSATVTDADGTVITVTIVGNGALELLAQGSGYALNISGTNAASVVTLTASGGDGKALLTGISADTALGQADLAAADLTGNASFAAVATLKLGNINNASITNGSVGEASLSAKNVADLRLSAPLAKLSVSADNWTTSAPGASPSASFLNAAGLRSLAVTGEFAADVRLSGTGITSGFVLDNASIGGALSSGQWFVIGRANSVQAGSTGGAWRAHFSGNLGQLKTTSDLSGFIAAGGLQLLSVGGSLRGATILPGANLGTDAQLGGTGDAADRFSAGTLARLRVVGDIVDTRIAISLDPVNGVLFDGNDVSVGTAANRMQELIVGGQLRGSTLIVAPALPDLVKVGGVEVAPATLPQLSTTPRDAVLPQLSAQLRSDTGSSASDGITSDASLLARVVDVGGVAALRGRINGSGTFQTLATTIQPDGAFLVTAASLTALNGGSLPDGAYSIELQAADFAGNASNTATVAFTLDRTAPSATVALAAASDTGTPGDNITTASSVTIEGSTSAGTVVVLANPAQSTTAAADGTFSFNGIALALGDNDFAFTLTDAAGNTGAASLRIRRDPPVVADTTPPTVTAALAADTGSSASDGITRNPEIAGQASDNVGVVQLLATLDPGASGTPTFTDLTGLLAAGGSFTLNRATLDSLAGGTLSDGAHTVRFIARDAAGNESAPRDVSFTLDTAAPSATLVLAAGSDTGTPGDNITTASSVTIGGSTEAGALVSLASPAQSTTAAADGSYSFTGLALALGANDFSVTVTDAAGNTGTAALRVMREAAGGADTTAPTITAALQADTGSSAIDGITNNPAISGQASDNVGVVQLFAAIDPGATPTFTDVSSLLAADGSFNLDRAALNGLAGGALADGAHTVRLVARDAAGNQSAARNVNFTLDTTPPASVTSFGLAAADASNAALDETSAGIVQLRGIAEQGATVTLAGRNLSAVAGAGGIFVIPGVTLTLGANVLTLNTVDAAGNVGAAAFTRTITRSAATQTDAVLSWNNIALRAIQLDVTDPEVATRTLAMLSLAQYDALAAIEGSPAFMVRRSVSGPVSADAAAAVAAHRILSLTYPAQKANFDAALVTSLAAVPDGAAKDTGIALGLSVADAVWAIRSGDGSDDYVVVEGSTEPGKWRPTEPIFDVAEDPEVAHVTPFALTSPDQFRPGPPPALDTAAYAANVNEIKALGRSNSTVRTADQTQQVHFWADGKGSYTPPGHWNLIAEQVAQAKGNSLSANARLFAQLNVALADAAIAAWDTKYTYVAWRPVTAIQLADTDNNPDTTADPDWHALLISPPHPDYVSGHSTFSAAAATVLAATFGDNTSFSTNSVTLPGVTRSFTSFSQAAEEAGRSRVYGGIHFTYANEAGKTLGRQVGAAVLDRFALTQDLQAPSIVLAAPPEATKTNVTLAGQVLDNLSGVAAAQYRIDGGTLQNLALGADGSFTVTTTLALDGTQDGVHTLSIVARDAAGNISAPLTRAFTLDTRAPTITLSGIADGDTLDASSRLAGTVEGSGSAVTQLAYRFDAGTDRSIAFDPATGSFDVALATGQLGIGDHVLTVVAKDLAGNTRTVTRSVTVPALSPLRLVAVTPGDGAIDVGVTQRPVVTFSRAVSANSLTADSLYATAPDGSKLAATIVPAADGTFAWLFFAAPMPGGARITLHVDGARIRAAADGSFLDADGDGTAGGVFTQAFTTVSSTPVAGTKIVGKVVDPGPDLEPMTFDDIRRGPDGIIHTADDVFLNPIAHAKVFVLGQEDRFVYTDAAGNFELDGVPAGAVKVAIDGRTATNAPSGVFFPEMVMAADLRGGVVNTLMGSMGTLAERLANLDRREVYLPRVASSVLQTVSDTQATVITAASASAAPALSEAQRSELTLTVAPGTLIGHDGQVLSNAQIGISTVPPELVRDMLPPGVLQHTFDITIQAPGVATFAQPVQITFPNVFNAAPGTKLNILSFDHTTGMLVINGTGTVSADGLTVVSDEGSGVKAPGWHGLTPPGGPSDPPCDPTPPHDVEVDPIPVTSGLANYFFKDDAGEFTLSFGNAAAKLDPSSDACSPTNLKATPLVVRVTVEGPNVNDFLTGLVTATYTLQPGQQQNIKVTVNDLLAGIKNIDKDRLYGAKIHVEAWKSSQPATLLLDRSVYVYRFLDAADSAHTDGVVEMADTTVDGAANTMRLRPIEHLSGVAQPTLQVADTTNFSNVGFPANFVFDPTVRGDDLQTTVTIKTPANEVAGTLTLKGDGDRQKYYIDGLGLRVELARLATDAAASATEQALIDTALERLDIADRAIARAAALLAPFAGGLDVVNAAGADVVRFDDFATPAGSPFLGNAFNVDNTANGGTAGLVTNRAGYSTAEQNFRLSEAMNESLTGRVAMYMENYFKFTTFTTADEIVNTIGKTLAHELGHNLGLNHTHDGGTIQPDGSITYTQIVAIAGANTDVMGQGQDLTAARTFGVTAGAFKVGAGLAWTSDEAQKAIDYFAAYKAAGGNFDLDGDDHAAPGTGDSPVGGANDPDVQPNPVINAAVPWIVTRSGGNFVAGQVDLGTVSADGSGGALERREFYLVNVGDKPLQVAELSLAGSSAYRLEGLSSNAPLAPQEARAFSVIFDPLRGGQDDATLRLRSNGLTGDYALSFTARGVSATRDIQVDIANNNLGGVATHAGAVRSNGVITIRNTGATDLTVNGISSLTSEFAVVGTAATVSAANPLVIAAGGSVGIDVSFDPGTTGLVRGRIQILSNDLDTPAIVSTVVGTGLASTGSALQYGNDFVALKFVDQSTTAPLRTVSDAGGNWSFFLPPAERVQWSVFDPASGLLASRFDLTAKSGEITHFNAPFFQASTAADSDGDGLPDDIEFAIGSNAASRDSDKDGLDDFVEIQRGLDPLGGLGTPVGVVSAAQLRGTAEAVAVVGAAGGADALTTVVATGQQGLALVDVAQFSRPTVLAELDLPGNSVDVAVDAARSLAAVAAGDGGLHIVNIADPARPVLVQTVNLPSAVNRVEIRDGIAYAAAGSVIALIDLNTGDTRSTLDLASLGGTTLTDIAIEGSTLYTMDTARTLRSISISGDLLTARDSIVLASAAGKLFVGGGVAYVGTTTDFTQGYSTVNVADPADLQLLSGIDAANIAGQSLAANGSGLLVTAGNLRGPRGEQIYAVDVSSSTDPANTNAFVTRINLPAAPKDIVLASGLAFVADGTSGLQVVNYTAFDNKGVAPTATISVAAVDADPAAPGVQVLEGRSLRVTPVVADDVQVRNVELLVNGVVVANDVSFPHEFFADIPTLAAGGSTVTVQVRATDTGGNVGLSNLVTLNVVRDTFAPVATSVSIANGDRRFFVRSIDLVFDEPLDVTLLDAARFVLVRAGTDNTFGTADDVTVPVRLDTRAQGQRLAVLIDGILPPGDYRLTIDPSTVSDRAGNRLTAPIVRTFNIRLASDVKALSGVPEIPTAPSANPGQQIGFTVPFAPASARAEFKVVDAAGNVSTRTVTPVRVDVSTQRAFFTVPVDAVTGDLVLYSLVGATRTDFADGTLPLQILPTITDVQVESVAADGSSAQVLIAGTGFVEATGSEYRFGSQSIVDSAAATGPDVFGRNDATLGFIANGYVRLTVPLSDGVFGAINLKTAGGVSASYTAGITSITATALSGTPADAGKASANAGQAVTLNGSNLSTTSDILLRYIDINGAQQMVRLSPSAASADGTSATLIVPDYANGAFSLQLFGSSTQPLLQIVPTLTSLDVQDRTVLIGSGFVEGASTYSFPGASVADTPADAANNVDVYYVPGTGTQNGSAYLNRSALPTHGLGGVTVSTAGGTSASLANNSVRTNVTGTNLGDVAVDAAGNLWVSDYANPGSLLKIDPATGQALQTIALTNAFGTPYTYNHSGLQVLGAAMTLNATSVPAGSLLVFNGYPNPDRVLAVNPATGAVIASLTLGANHDLTGATYDAASNRIFLSETNGAGNRIVAVSATTGAELASFTAPFNITNWSGLAIDPTSGHLWLGAINGGSQLVEYLIGAGGALTELRRVDASAQGINQNEISGLSFDATGALWVASTQGEVYKIDTARDSAAVPSATLTGLASLALQGTPANAGVASANIGQVIELTGTNFGAGTRVLFTIRDNAGATRVVSQEPLVINAGGTRLQVQVPDAATTADVRVVNQGSRNLGFNGSYADAVYRNVSVNFTAGSANATIRFADGGLQGLADESWGIDNVSVKRGDALVFADNFESGAANAAWSDASVNADAIATFSRFSGRFSDSASQVLNLAGLTAGQTYTLNFDLLVLDSWDGSNPSVGPDLIDVSVDGKSLLRETLANYLYDATSAQTFRASAGIRLQVVPTLTGIINGRPGEDDSFNLIGSGFMEGASTVTIGGVAFIDSASNLTPFDVTGARNDNMTVVAPRTLDGPIRISTEGGFAQLPLSLPVQAASVFTGITASANAGVPGNASQPSANTGQTITLTGQGFTGSTLVQFQGGDDSGANGTLTRTGTVGAGGTTLTVTVPAIARSGAVTVLGSGASFELQIVPTLKSAGGTVAAGNTLVLEGSGFSAEDLAITIDGRGVGSFAVRTVVDGTNGVDQQLITLSVPAGVSAGLINVSSGGGSAVLRSTLAITALADQTPAADIGDTIATALNTNLAGDQRIAITAGIGVALDVDLYRVDMTAGEQLTLNVSNAAGYNFVRIFDATGAVVQTPVQFNPGSANNLLRWTAPAGGSFYIGLSGYANTSYNPNVANSGNNASYLGAYTLSLERLAAGSDHLIASTTSATSGTAAQAALASANIGQTVTFSGIGLVASDRLVFTTLDDSGNLGEAVVAASTVDLGAQTISAVVPVNATTGRVRLERDATGVLLQVVPVLSDVTMNAGGGFEGANLQLSGSGFAEGAVTVQLGGQNVADIDRFYGNDVFGQGTRINVAVPAGAATGPVRVATVGGTSTAFGITLTSIGTGTTSGTPTNAATAATNAGQAITLNGSGLDATTDVVFKVTDAAGNLGDLIVRATAVNAAGTQLQVLVPINATSGVVRVVGSADAIALQILPTITDVQIESVAADGSTAQLLIAGTGLVEGNNSEYRFGSRVVLDAGTTTGADVFGRNDATLGFIANGYVRLTVPLSDGVFGAINLKTAGGVSASYTAGITSITATALSGTPADAGKASANAGQAVTLNGSNLSTTSDILLRYIDINGAQQMVRLSPSAASADGTSATLIVPDYANGAFSLQLFGSSTQPLLQIVPTLTSLDVQDRTVLIGSGFVEGASTYSFPGASVADTPADAANNVDVYYVPGTGTQNGSAYLNRSALPTHGLGGVTVSTAGGTSASLANNSVRTNVTGTNLGDVAVDAAGNLWVSDYANPGSLLKIDPATGQALQTIALTNAFGTPYTYNHSGLQVLGAAMTLNATSVPAGSLLVFNGYPNPDRVLAVNPATGAVIASLTLGANHDLTGATYDAASNRIFLSETNGAGNRIVAVSATTGAELASFTAPFNITNWSGLAIDPTSGHLWLGAINGGSQLVEYLIGAGGALTELRRVDASAQGINQNEISGLSFDATGALWVASTQGEVYKIDTARDSAAVPSATLTGLASLALQGTPANAGVASANIGQVIELTGTNFGAGTRVLFTIRDNAGATRVVSQEPLVINAGGTRLQVQVPDAATTADVRVVNQGSRNLGFNGSYADAVYRNVSVNFTAGSANATIRFADGGLQGLADESWGIDNVSVKRGDALVFADNFESGAANAAWSDASVNADAIATFSRFSGRFSDSASQVLNLAGLTAGQTYTLNFDLLVLDSWDGSNPSVGPDLIDVSVDGKSLLRETLANYLYDATSAQTFRASAGIRLQVVPTLTGIINGRPGEDDSFNLIGSGFMEGASTVTIGGVAFIDSASNLTPFDVTGARNDNMTVVAPRTLDGPIRISTEGGFAQLPLSLPVQAASVFTGITASANAGVPGNASQPSANTGQTITLTGQGFTGSTLVQFQGGDDSGANGTLTRTGTVGAGGTTLTVTVPAIARSGAVTVLGSGASFELQIVPTLKSAGGTVAAGNTLVLEGSGFSAEDLAITIDGRGVGSFAVRTVVDGTNGVDQQLITLSVPAGVSAGLINVSSGGGSAVLRSTLAITALADQTPAADIGDTIATALNTNLAGDQRIAITAGIGVALDVDLYRVDMTAGEQLTLNVSNAAGYNFVRIFDATGAVVQTPVQFNPGSANNLLRWTAPAGGSFYIGLSGYANTSYNPNVANSGNNASYLGAYTLSLERLAAGSDHLIASTTSATSGTAAQAALASANIGQTVTFSGIGLVASDRLVFTTLDDSGNLGEAVVAASTVDLGAQTISAVVPVNATTGRVRLERDATGVLLQVVPVLSDVTMNAGGGFEGANLQLSGSGFAEGAVTVQLGGQNVADIDRFYGNDVFSQGTRINVAVPAGAATGPVRVATVGGTSTAFGITLTSIGTGTTSGTPTNAATAATNAGQAITLNGSGLDATTDVVFKVTDAAGNLGDLIVRATAVNAAGTQLQVLVPINATSGVVRVVGSADAIALQILPTITDVQIESVAADGSTAQLLIAGTGLVEGNNSEYRFGSRVVLDAGTTTGADVFGRNDATLGFIANGYVRLTVPLSDGVFGAINLKTAGGVSASYTAGITSITATALSGTPADAGKASANAGQAVTLNGSNLSTTSDILLRYIDINGAQQMVRLSPSAASADGTSATLIVPDYANGAFSLQLFGSSTQPLLQIVPTLTSLDVQDRTVLIGSGFVEGASTYSFPGASVADTPADAANNVDVYYVPGTGTQNGSAYLNRSALPTHGLGGVTVSTAGGTSASLANNSVRTNVTGTNLGDVAVDAAGNLWVSDYANPGSLLKIDPATGQVLQTIALTNAFGTPYTYNHSGLQVLGAAMTLNATSVPAGSLLVFNGYPNPDRVLAVNPATGAVIASLTLGANHDLTGATYDAASNRIFLSETNGAGNRIVAVSATTGAELASFTAPFNITNWSGLAIDPTSGHLWLGAINGGSQLVEYLIGAGGALTELRRVDASAQGINQNEISGLSFDATGALWVASTQGEIYKITLP